MNNTIRLTGAALLCVSLQMVPAAADALKAGEKVFKRCKACHSVGDKAKNKVGPQLNDLIGRTAGSIEDFKYSKAMTAAGEGGLAWNDETMAEFFKKPKKFVKGTKMGFAGLKKDQQITDLIVYLKSYSKAASQ